MADRKKFNALMDIISGASGAAVGGGVVAILGRKKYFWE